MVVLQGLYGCFGNERSHWKRGFGNFQEGQKKLKKLENRFGSLKVTITFAAAKNETVH